jgi:gamma-glutamyl:cysteine ligase YbdK (ATP-grasp superfamily)
LEVAYNKYYLKHTTIVSHKLIFVMVRRDPILDTIEKRVKENPMEAQLWA